MTVPPSSVGAREWWTRPSVVLPIVGTIALIVALLTPQAASGRFGDSRLSSHLAGSLGARLFADMAGRLGWRVVQRDSSPAPVLATGRTIHAVMSPAIPLTASEAHRYLEAVREGDALLLVLNAREPISDSLGVAPSPRDGMLPTPPEGSAGCTGRLDFTPPLWPDGRVHLLGLRWLRGRPEGAETFAQIQRVRMFDAAAGFPYGRGRVVVVADPDLLRNDVLRHCAWGADVIAVRMLEWLRVGGAQPRTTLAFDEYHQGFGPHPGTTDVVAEFLTVHPVGRTLLQVMAAALILLWAVAPRPIPPPDVERIERRDPLEQVDALSHAYEQVHATRTVTARLLRGMRWRVERSAVGSRTRPDDAFLEAALARTPSLKDDVTLVRKALHESLPDQQLPDIGAALRRIELTLTTTSA
jgi:hypothetical protein